MTRDLFYGKLLKNIADITLGNMPLVIALLTKLMEFFNSRLSALIALQ